MKQLLFIVLVALLAATSAQAADVGVSISVGQPGFYGHIDIGDLPKPEIVYSRPVVIQPAPPHVVYEPLYLRVPPGHAKHWKKHCGEYNACNRPVYFVKDKWYNDVYVPRYQERERNRREHGGGHDMDRGGKHERGGPDRDDRGHGHGHDRDR